MFPALSRFTLPFRPLHEAAFVYADRVQQVAIRPVRPEDKERIVRAFSSLHPRSVYQRFFYPKRALTDRELRWVTEPDGIQKVALVATVRRDGEEIVVGLGQYVANGPSAEVAFVVVESYQGQGTASRMLRELASIARKHGIRLFEADVLADNAPMLAVFRRCSPSISESESDGVVHVSMSLPPPSIAKFHLLGRRATARHRQEP